jgi:hypothetical protein
VHDVEVDQQPKGFAAELEIGNDLGLMHGGNSVNGFYLHDHEILHQQINAVTDV